MSAFYKHPSDCIFSTNVYRKEISVYAWAVLKNGFYFLNGLAVTSGGLIQSEDGNNAMGLMQPIANELKY